MDYPIQSSIMYLKDIGIIYLPIPFSGQVGCDKQLIEKGYVD